MVYAFKKRENMGKLADFGYQAAGTALGGIMGIIGQGAADRRQMKQQKKLQELEEADISSSKDIADLLALSHKMRMDELAAMTKLIEAQTKQETVRNQTNIQINEALPGNYGALVEKIMKMK